MALSIKLCNRFILENFERRQPTKPPTIKHQQFPIIVLTIVFLQTEWIDELILESLFPVIHTSILQLHVNNITRHLEKSWVSTIYYYCTSFKRPTSLRGIQMMVAKLLVRLIIFIGDLWERKEFFTELY